MSSEKPSWHDSQISILEPLIEHYEMKYFQSAFIDKQEDMNKYLSVLSALDTETAKRLKYFIYR